MKAVLVRRAELPAEHPPLVELAGMILCHDLRDGDGARELGKGHVLSADDVRALPAMSWDELHLLEMDAGDVHEGEAGARLARAAAGEGIVVGAPSGGHWAIASASRGVLGVAPQQLRGVNEVDGACVYTLIDGQVVDAGEVVARAKITPFAIEGAGLERAESIARERGGVVRVRPFVPMRVGAVVQETLGDRAMARFREALEEKVGWLGSQLLPPAFVAPDEAAIADALEAQLAAGAQVVAMAGTKSMDVLDPAFRALARLGVALERHGVPAHPGSLFWMARLRGVPVLGMPTCGLFSQASVFDIVLPRVLTGEPFGRAELAALGHGGLLTREMAFRFPPYRATRRRGEVGDQSA